MWPKKKKRQRSTVVSWEISQQCKGTQSSRGWLAPTFILQIASCLQCYSRLRKGPRDSSCWAHCGLCLCDVTFKHCWFMSVLEGTQISKHWRIDAFELWCWRRLWKVPWTARRASQSILKEINSEYILEGLILKLQYFGHPIGKDPDTGKDWGQEEKGTTEDEIAGWHHWLNAHEFEQTLGDSEGQRSLVCSSSWSCKGSDTT